MPRRRLRPPWDGFWPFSTARLGGGSGPANLCDVKPATDEGKLQVGLLLHDNTWIDHLIFTTTLVAKIERLKAKGGSR